jgi:hypothetical protein
MILTDNPKTFYHFLILISKSNGKGKDILWGTYTYMCFNCYLRFYGAMRTMNGWCVSELLGRITQECLSRAAVVIDAAAKCKVGR